MSDLDNIMNPNSLIRFPIDRILDNSTTDFDLYLDVKGEYILYGNIGYHWLKEELDRLIHNGVDHFFVRKEDQFKIKMYDALSELPKIEKNLAPIERIKTIEQVGAAFTKCLYEGEITEASIAKAKTIATSVTECVREDNRCIQFLSGLANHDYYTYYHSIRVSTYAVAIAQEMGLTDQQKVEEIALGGIFHDIGKKFIDLSIINKKGALTKEEWAQMRSHPASGKNCVSQSILSSVPREIIHHHHEKLDGSGYPDGYDKNSLLPEVQIATLADVFDALTSSRSYQNKRTRYEALDLMKQKMVGHKLPTEAFMALISCLGN